MGRQVIVFVVLAVVLLGILERGKVLDWWKHRSNSQNSATEASPPEQPVSGSNFPGKNATSPGEAADAITSTYQLPLNPPPSRKAVPGFLYVLRYVSTTTETGLVGVGPGTRLALLDRGRTKSTLTDGTNDFVVENEYVTDDMDAAAMAARTDSQSQAALAAWMAQRAPSSARSH